ncbi:ABC transporter ATP-binding protein [Micrococcaceae bacterium Sec5.1]
MSADRQTRGAGLSLRRLAKSYGSVHALKEVSLDIAPGEFVTFLGPSGSGKSTTLNLISGFQEVTSGEILLDGTALQDVKPHKRELGIVFQNYALFPHMTANQNIEYSLKQRKVPTAERKIRVQKALASVGLSAYGDRYPRELSGGQQQRVAVARALVFEPRVLLMDEPLGALDRKLRQVLQLEIKRLHRELGITFIFVTHDQEEALVMSDRIAVFNDGLIEQVGTAAELYENPATPFVAEFLGETNALKGVIETAGSGVLVRDSGAWRTGSVDDERLPAGPAILFVRPEKVRLVTEAKPVKEHEDSVFGVVRETVYMGSLQKILVTDEEGATVTVLEATGAPLPAIGSRVGVAWDISDAHVISTDKRIQPAKNDEVVSI